MQLKSNAAEIELHLDIQVSVRILSRKVQIQILVAIHALGNITALSDPKTQNLFIGPLNARRRELSNGVRKYTIGIREGTQASLVP